MILAMAPAGLAEMVLTGKLLGLDATVITGFQLTRIIVVLIWCRTALILFERLADWTFGKVAARRQVTLGAEWTTRRLALC